MHLPLVWCHCPTLPKPLENPHVSEKLEIRPLLARQRKRAVYIVYKIHMLDEFQAAFLPEALKRREVDEAFLTIVNCVL